MGEGVKQAEAEVTPEQGVPLEGPGGEALDITLRLHRGTSTATGILLRGWLRTTQEGVPCTEALVLNWETAQLQVHAHLMLSTVVLLLESKIFTCCSVPFSSYARKEVKEVHGDWFAGHCP